MSSVTFNIPIAQWTRNAALKAWIEAQIALCKPSRVHLCSGSAEESEELSAQLVASGLFVPLKKRPGSFWCRTHPDDVARVEECTFICSKTKDGAGPTNNWYDPAAMKSKLQGLFDGSMAGRVMYVIPYCMGPLGSPLSKFGVEITDSAYVVLNMRLMTRMGNEALESLGNGEFVPGLHSVGMPLVNGAKDVPWPCNLVNRVIAHFPDEKSIFSYGSGYGGNALLGKKCLALRIASSMGRSEGWLAEHMLILGITSPQGVKKYIAAAFPSACGKTNLAMMEPSLSGWKVECVGDDIAWMRFGIDGRLYAINPEAGFFGVAPGTSMKTNPNAMKTIDRNAIFTNVALTQDGDVWWEGMTKEPPAHLTSWKGEAWTPALGTTAAHPNARFTVSAVQCPIYDKMAEDPKGVPISAILFGGRRHSLMPLILEAFDWNHGVFLGASLSSETTAAAKGEIGKLRHDPFAMLPFCGYHMGDYFSHWIEMGRRTSMAKLPKIFAVNWFRKGHDGKFMWPGFGENVRVLKWIFERVDSESESVDSPIGKLPTERSFDMTHLPVLFEPLFSMNRGDWLEEIEELSKYFQIFGNRFPAALSEELRKLDHRLERGHA